MNPSLIIINIIIITIIGKEGKLKEKYGNEDADDADLFCIFKMKVYFI